MDLRLSLTRLHKLAVSATHPSCWKALSKGVAPSAEHLRTLRGMPVDGIIDVGANRGQFSLACAIALPGVPIVAFEPIPSEARLYRLVHGAHPRNELIETALGESNFTTTFHLSKNADSSSILPIGSKQTELFRNTAEAGTFEVEVKRLDDFSRHWRGRHHQLLKIDVQGYELQVLRGAAATLATCAFVYAECSEIQLYDGQALRADVETFLREHAFEVRGRHNAYYAGGKLIQADYLFARPERQAASHGG